MSTETLKQPRTRTPRDYDSILKGAIELPLAERAKLRDELVKSVMGEVEQLKQQAEQASKLLG